MENQILDDGLFDKPTELDGETVQKINNLKNLLNEDIQRLIYARNALAVLAILTFIGMLVGMVLYADSAIEVVVEGLIVIAVYIACLIGIYYNSRASLIVAIIFYFLVWGIYILVDPGYFFKGIILKIIIIYFLSRGIASAFKLNNGFKKLIRLGVPKEEILQAKKLKRLPRTFTSSNVS